MIRFAPLLYRVLAIVALTAGCTKITPKPVLFPPEPKVWSLVPRDATVVAAMNVKAVMSVVDEVLRAPSWGGAGGIRSIVELRARFKTVFGIDPGLLTKAVLVLQLTSSNVYGGFLLYGAPRSVIPNRRSTTHLGQPIYRLRYLYVALIADAVVLGDLRFVKRVLDLRYGVASAKTVSSALWTHHADSIPSALVMHQAFVADMKLLAERFAVLRKLKLNYGAGALNVDRGALVVLDTEHPHRDLRPTEDRLRTALRLARAALDLAVRFHRGVSLGRLRLNQDDLRRVAIVLHRTQIKRSADTIRIAVSGSLRDISRVLLKLTLVSLTLFEKHYKPL